MPRKRKDRQRYEADPYSAFVQDFQRAYHSARFAAEQMSDTEYAIIMRLADVLVEQDPHTDAMLDRSSL